MEEVVKYFCHSELSVSTGREAQSLANQASSISTRPQRHCYIHLSNLTCNLDPPPPIGHQIKTLVLQYGIKP